MDRLALENNYKLKECAIVVPTHKSVFSADEKICIEVTFKNLKNRDIFFVTPDSVNLSEYLKKYNVNQIFFPGERFESFKNYNDWMLSTELYERFLSYEYILICQTDAIVIRDDLSYWASRQLDYIGAPWPRKVIFQPNFSNKPHLKGARFEIEVGNGGLSLRNVKNTISVLKRYDQIISEYDGAFEDVMFGLLGLIDKEYRIATLADAAAFSLEVSAREIINITGNHPMGFHKLYEYDREFWEEVLSNYR
jgi:hypothetical protein